MTKGTVSIDVDLYLPKVASIGTFSLTSFRANSLIIGIKFSFQMKFSYFVLRWWELFSLFPQVTVLTEIFYWGKSSYNFILHVIHRDKNTTNVIHRIIKKHFFQLTSIASFVLINEIIYNVLSVFLRNCIYERRFFHPNICQKLIFSPFQHKPFLMRRL